MIRLNRLAALFALALPLAACSSDEGAGSTCVDGKCDDLDKPDSEIADSPCDGTMVDMSGRRNQKVAGRLNDDRATLDCRPGHYCPVTFQYLMAKLTAAYEAACADDPGLATAMVSETAQLLDKATNYRGVTTKRCGERPGHGVLFSLFGVRAGAKTLPANAEMIAFDSSAGVFNYYVTEGDGAIQFMGNSVDMLKGPGSGGARRCAACHTGGGLIMKELESPWVHWEGDTETPGVSALIEKHEALLGSQSDGIDMESITREGNDAWNDTRIAFLKANGTTADLLRPLFCTVEINLGSAGASSEVFDVPGKYLVSTELGFPFVEVDDAEYQAIIKANGQEVGGSGKLDTIFAWTAPERSAADMAYVQKLVSKKIISQQFAHDVLLVDFTRPIFSDDRCALLEFAPDLTPANKKSKNITDGFIKKLEAAAPAAGTPAAELLANLKAKTDNSSERVDAFAAVCDARNAVKIDVGGTQVSSFLKDMLAVTSARRDEARQLPVMEFGETMPADGQGIAASTRLHPATCELTTDFVPVAGTPLPTPPAGG